jgi:hypothetical protein
MIRSYPQEVFQKKCQLIVKDLLKENYVELRVNNFILREGKKTSIECEVHFSNDWSSIFIEGSGDGFIDALFNTMVTHFSEQFTSLKNISFDDFIMQVKFKSNVRRSASPVEVKLALKNAREKNIYFSSESQSMVKAAIAVVVNACEYLINAETAIVQLKENIEDAKDRRRNDLVEIYTHHMIDLVNIISYEGVV